MQNAQKRMEHSELSLSSQTCSKPTRKISSSEAAETASFMALSSSSSAVRSPEIARRISGPMSWSVRRPACKTANYRASYLRVGTGEITALPFLPKHCGALLLSIAPPAPRTPTNSVLSSPPQRERNSQQYKPRNVCCQSLASSQEDIDVNPQA